MKIIYKKLLLLTVFSILTVSCQKEQKELTEKELITEVKLATKDSIIDKVKFQKEILPIVRNLKEKDSTKYFMITHIAEKLEKEKNPEILQLNYNDLRGELKLIK